MMLYITESNHQMNLGVMQLNLSLLISKDHKNDKTHPRTHSPVGADP